MSLEAPLQYSEAHCVWLLVLFLPFSYRSRTLSGHDSAFYWNTVYFLWSCCLFFVRNKDDHVNSPVIFYKIHAPPPPPLPRSHISTEATTQQSTAENQFQLVVKFPYIQVDKTKKTGNYLYPASSLQSYMLALYFTFESIPLHLVFRFLYRSDLTNRFYFKQALYKLHCYITYRFNAHRWTFNAEANDTFIAALEMTIVKLIKFIRFNAVINTQLHLRAS